MTKTIITAIALAIAIPATAADQNGQDITRAQVEARIQERFALNDADKDGFVTQAEFAARRDARRAEKRAARFDQLDADRNGQISRAEFERGAKAGMRGNRPGQGAGRGDANQDGKISLAEARNRALARFDAADADHNGVLTRAERQAARQARMPAR